jgi:hypothetical protein
MALSLTSPYYGGGDNAFIVANQIIVGGGTRPPVFPGSALCALH